MQSCLPQQATRSAGIFFAEWNEILRTTKTFDVTTFIRIPTQQENQKEYWTALRIFAIMPYKFTLNAPDCDSNDSEIQTVVKMKCDRRYDCHSLCFDNFLSHKIVHLVKAAFFKKIVRSSGAFRNKQQKIVNFFYSFLQVSGSDCCNGNLKICVIV